MRKKGKALKIIILLTILIIAGVFFINNRNKPKLEIKVWNNIYNENNINMYYGEKKDAKVKALDNVYKANELVSTEDGEVNKVLKVIDIVNTVVEFDDVSDSKGINAFDILQEKAKLKKVSQRDMAIITRDLLLTIDIKSRVGKFEKVKKGSDEEASYYVVEYWSNENSKWVMIDFRNRGYIEKDGIPCSSIEIMTKLDKSMVYKGTTKSKEYIKDLKKVLDTYTINIDNSIEMKKSNSYITYIKDKGNINIKLNNSYIPPTIFTENEELFKKDPMDTKIGVDEKEYIILMKKENNKEDSEVKSENYIVGGFKDGKIMNKYYIRENNGEFKEVEKYYELQLVNGTNIIELSIDGANIISSIEIEYVEGKRK